MTALESVAKHFHRPLSYLVEELGGGKDTVTFIEVESLYKVQEGSLVFLH